MVTTVAWRDHRDRTARKYALWDAGERLPPNEWEPGKPSSIYMKWPCGDIFNSHRLEDNLVHVPHITAAHAPMEFDRDIGGFAFSPETIYWWCEN